MKKVSSTLRWALVDRIVKESKETFPLGWQEFENNLARNRTEYGLATQKNDKDLRIAISFPVFQKGGQEYSIEDDIKAVMPEYMKDDTCYKEFVARYPEFIVPRKLILK